MYPVYRSHANARCFCCQPEVPLAGDVRESENPPGHGQFSQQCPRSKMRTFYDITGETAPVLKTVK